MRELSVYYCPKCGRYAYYQLIRNTVCPNCNEKMTFLDMNYQDFMHLSHEERDNLLIQEILTHSHSISNRILAADRAHNKRQIIATLNTRIQELEDENRQLNATIEWMHETIWELLRRNRAQESSKNTMATGTSESCQETATPEFHQEPAAPEPQQEAAATQSPEPGSQTSEPPDRNP